jgi:hypothetical protein
MSVTLFFGIRLSGRPYERIAHKLDEDSYSTYTVENLKKVLASELLRNYADASGLGESFISKTKNALFVLALFK